MLTWSQCGGLGLSQAAFARAFGLDVTAIHAWDQGRRRPYRAALAG